MRWIAIGFVVFCFLVPVGFYIQATGDFRTRARLEPWAEMKFHAGMVVALKSPVPVCESRALCAEARKVTRRVHEARIKGKPKEIENADQYFAMLKDSIKFADEVALLNVDPRYTHVRITRGSQPGFVGYVYTIGLEEEGILPEEPAGQSKAPSAP